MAKPTRINDVVDLYGQDAGDEIILAALLFATANEEEHSDDCYGVSPGEVAALRKLGVLPDDDINIHVFVDDESFDNVTRRRPKLLTKQRSSGWWLFVYLDDYGWTLYKDGQPIGGYYISTRGGAWQAGLYVHTDQTRWSTDNFRDNGGDGEWQQSFVDDINSSIPMSFLLGEEN